MFFKNSGKFDSRKNGVWYTFRAQIAVPALLFFLGGKSPPAICNYYYRQPKQRIFFLNLLFFFQKMETKKKQKSENSPNKPIKISYLNRFYTKIPLRTNYHMVCSIWYQSTFELDSILHLKSVWKSWNISKKIFFFAQKSGFFLRFLQKIKIQKICQP